MSRLKTFREFSQASKQMQMKETLLVDKGLLEKVFGGSISGPTGPVIVSSPFSRLKELRDKEKERKQRRTKLRTDLTRSGIFPEKDQPMEQRLADYFAIMKGLNEAERPIIDAQVQRIMRVLKSSNNVLDDLARAVGASRYSNSRE